MKNKHLFCILFQVLKVVLLENYKIQLPGYQFFYLLFFISFYISRYHFVQIFIISSNEPPTKFSKKGRLTGSQFLAEGYWERVGDLFKGRGAFT